MEETLQPCALRPLPLSALRPRGWLRRQLRIQADGLSGRLGTFWPDIRDSRWFGGRSEGWERAPYWLDGVLPLAFLAEDEPLRIQVLGHLDYVIRHQAQDGWIGPRGETGEARKRVDLWGQFLMLKVLAQYGDATGDPRATQAVAKGLEAIERHIGACPLFQWAMFRSFEALIPLLWLYERQGGAHLAGLATKLTCQGFDWVGYFENWPRNETQRAAGWTYAGHVVNNAMALKAPALLWRLSGESRHRQLPRQMLELLDRHHGQANGTFSGDECLAGRNPAQGTELCAVVEMMYSLEILTSILGDPAYADRLEELAFNALPATCSPEMWTHQYDQQVNQVACTVRKNHPWTTNGPEANIFGLEPNYGCCTANFSQGWPKFAAHLWMAAPNGGLSALGYAPCQIHTTTDGLWTEVTVEGEYPFRDRIQIEVRTSRPARFPLHLRIPAWAQGAEVRLADGKTTAPEPGQFCSLERVWEGTTALELRLPMRPRAERRWRNSLSIRRGPLLYALAIDEEWTELRSDRPYREHPHADFEVRPRGPWNYALAVDESSLEKDLTFTEHPGGERPFSAQGALVSARVKGRCIPDWQAPSGDALEMPESPVSSAEPLEELKLLPYGCTRLRIAEFPTL